MRPARWREGVVVEFRILGPVDALAEGRPLALGGRRERAVLALLLLSANRVVSSERLADELWPDRPPKEALHSLRVAVSRLRKVLHEAAGAEVLCTGGSHRRPGPAPGPCRLHDRRRRRIGP